MGSALLSILASLQSPFPLPQALLLCRYSESDAVHAVILMFANIFLDKADAVVVNNMGGKGREGREGKSKSGK